MPLWKGKEKVWRICKHVAYIYTFQPTGLVTIRVILSSQIRNNRTIEYGGLVIPYPFQLIPLFLLF